MTPPFLTSALDGADSSASRLCRFTSWIETSLSIIYLSIYPSMGLQTLWTLAVFQFLNLYTFGRTPWMGNQPVARLLPTYRTTQTQDKFTQTAEWDSNPLCQCSSGGRQFVP
jgi:hypothetical protein